MSTPKEIFEQIKKLTAEIIGCGLTNDQNFPSLKETGGFIEVGLTNNGSLSSSLRNISYSEIYTALLENKAYSIKMVDGALIQLMYSFKNEEIIKHRLAFFPCPFLEEYQNNPEIYDSDTIYAEIISRNIVPFPIRFDFDSNETVIRSISHPVSHVTLGQYKNCRIPASSAVSPSNFLTFILRNFYNTAFNEFSNNITIFEHKFPRSLFKEEEEITHLSIF